MGKGSKSIRVRIKKKRKAQGTRGAKDSESDIKSKTFG